ncbi:hypothetical protein DL98DRAFT_598640 [Cadophora sp. DSE1049]|nr:hypothetical protein DL98DRAFT_598640 [Cadophora sp. DSE1049]
MTEALKPLLGESIFTFSGPKWQHSRPMIRPNLIKDQFADAEMPIFEKHFDRILSIIPKDGSKVDRELNAAIDLLTGQDVQSSQPSLLGEDDITWIFDDAEKHHATSRTLLASLPPYQPEQSFQSKFPYEQRYRHVFRRSVQRPSTGMDFEKTTAPNARSNWLYESKFLAASLRSGCIQRACTGTHTYTYRTSRSSE